MEKCIHLDALAGMGCQSGHCCRVHVVPVQTDQAEFLFLHVPLYEHNHQFPGSKLALPPVVENDSNTINDNLK